MYREVVFLSMHPIVSVNALVNMSNDKFLLSFTAPLPLNLCMMGVYAIGICFCYWLEIAECPFLQVMTEKLYSGQCLNFKSSVLYLIMFAFHVTPSISHNSQLFNDFIMKSPL